jgi:undecaprenyl-diphosphatase
MPPRADALPLRHALALGLLHGPTELLPVSSSGHTTLVPWLLGWPYPQLDPELRKAFEVGLHAGTAAGLLIALAPEVREAAEDLDARRLVLLAGSFAPPAIAGLLFERQIERRFGTPGSIAAGLVAGGAAMAIADARGARVRQRADAGAGDALALGLAQASALIPGVSRGGMTLAAMRARGFDRADASALSRHVALPVIAGATALKGVRLAQRGVAPGFAGRHALGAAASFASTLAAARLVPVERVGPLLPYAVYRAGIAALVARRLQRH